MPLILASGRNRVYWEPINIVDSYVYKNDIYKLLKPAKNITIWERKNKGKI